VRDGLSILEELLSDPRTQGTPVILLTAKTQMQDRLDGWRAGCSEYVTKPFSPVALAELVEQVAEMGPSDLRDRRRHELGHLDPEG
jgi:CheY-like chemotaxis protein